MSTATTTLAAPNPTATRTLPTATPTADFDYGLQPGSPSYVPNIFRQDLGCQWLGVAGQVFDREGNPVLGVIVEAEGELGGQQVLELSISGGAAQYGSGGYEITLADRPLASSGAMQIRLYDLQGQIISQPVVFDTLDSCTSNLILINFLANDYFQARYYLPLTSNQSNPR